MIYFNKKNSPYLFPLIWLLITAVLQWLGKPSFRYESDVISTFEFWRLLTGHWVHLNWTHWLLNNLGFILLVAITKVSWRVSFWVKLIISHSIFISLALLIFNPQLNWYVGFSGVLYGLYMVVSIVNFKKDRLISMVIIAIILVKIGLEQSMGSDISTQALLGAPVIVDAHAYGVLFGIGISLVLMIRTKINKLK